MDALILHQKQNAFDQGQRRSDEHVKHAASRLPAAYAASRLAFLRSCSFRKRLRRRIDLGVISTSSSSAMNSTAYSSDIWIGGTRRTASSVPDERTLVSCLPLIGLTTRSLSREWIPMIMPSYTGSLCDTNMRPRSCSFQIA